MANGDFCIAKCLQSTRVFKYFVLVIYFIKFLKLFFTFSISVKLVSEYVRFIFFLLHTFYLNAKCILMHIMQKLRKIRHIKFRKTN